jgi:hypothetical protein
VASGCWFLMRSNLVKPSFSWAEMSLVKNFDR